MTRLSADIHLEKLVDTGAIGMMSLMNDRTFTRHRPGGACRHTCHWHDEVSE